MTDIRHLRSFCALGDTLHFGMAAARLNIVQPALSGHIKQIEAHLGVRLVERSRHHVRLTPAGHDFLRHARGILMALDRAIESARHAGIGLVGSLRIGVVSSALNLFLAAAIRVFEDAWPGVDISLVAIDSCQQAEALAERRLDLGFVRLPFSRTGIQTRLVAVEGFSTFLHKDHPLTACPRIGVASLRGQTVLMLARENAPGYHDALWGACHRGGLIAGRVKYFREYESAVQMAHVGLGVAIVPDGAVAAHGAGVSRIPLDLGAHRSEIGAAWVTPLSPIVETFLAGIDRHGLVSATNA